MDLIRRYLFGPPSIWGDIRPDFCGSDRPREDERESIDMLERAGMANSKATRTIKMVLAICLTIAVVLGIDFMLKTTADVVDKAMRAQCEQQKALASGVTYGCFYTYDLRSDRSNIPARPDTIRPAPDAAYLFFQEVN